jgi:uncharacterized protein YjeT (DUF2065 family)
MLYDSMLVIGFLIVAYGVLRTLAQLSERRLPGVGVFMLSVGAAMIYFVQIKSAKGLTLTDLPDALFRIIGNLT